VRDLKFYGLKKRIDVTNSEPINDVLQYNFSKNGACGSLVIKPNCTRPIVGMHVAGCSNLLGDSGYCVLVSQETFLDLPDNDRVIEDEYPLGGPPTDSKLAFDDFVEVENMVKLDKYVHLPTKTKIRPSLLNGYDGPPKTLPSFLTRDDEDYPHEKSPLVAGCEKHGVLTKNPSQDMVNTLIDALWSAEYIRMKPLILDPKKLSRAEAVRGFAIDGYEPLKLNTSMGYPFVYETSKQKKDYIVVTEDPEIGDRAVLFRRDLIEHLDEIDKQRFNLIIPFLPYIDELKDERKKILKRLKLGGTRVFCMSPISNTMAGRQNFLHFAAAYKANCINFQHAVGIARDGPQWSLLANELITMSNNIICLDYSNFGPGYNAMFCAGAHELIVRWTKTYVAGINQNELQILGEEHYNSKHVMYDYVYRQFSGGPSGDSLTVVKNGIVNELYILFAWCGIIRGVAELNDFGENLDLVELYFRNVRTFVYGDDVIMAVSDAYIDRFNGITISDFLKTYDIGVTSANKSGEIVRCVGIDEATFLKSAFKPHPIHFGEWLAPMDIDSIEETPRWINECTNHVEATRVNAEAALRLSYGHGPEYFARFKEKLNFALGNAEIPGLTLTWSELDQNFFSNYYLK